MRRNEQRVESIDQSNFAQNIGNRNGKARRAKRDSSKRLRQALKKRQRREECPCDLCQCYGNGTCEYDPNADPMLKFRTEDELIEDYLIQHPNGPFGRKAT